MVGVPLNTERRKHGQIARHGRCKNLTGHHVSEGAPPPFDVARAHELYQALFGQIADIIKDKSLLVVPSGPLTQLPFQVLVTDQPESAIPADAADYAKAAWLIRRHAVTVLPSVASLKSLRQHARESQASNAFVGFGNPLLVGPAGTDKSAWERQSCPKEKPPTESVEFAGWPVAEGFASLFRGSAAGVVPETFANLYRGGVADVAALRLQAPLPESTDELCAVSRELDATDDNVYLGSRATETQIRKLNSDGSLAAARIVHFATHGLIASETESVANTLSEPALMLTPPDTVTELDDGLLTASEVTELKLNADWVVLSACNTAAGGEKGNAEALSGLARAFFYAGARALLVSHWYVDSRAAVKLTTGAFAALKQDPSIGRAEAMRRSMLAAMIDVERPKDWIPAAHPAVWAPFVVVGEGGARSAADAMPPAPTDALPSNPAQSETEAVAAPVSTRPEEKPASIPAPSAAPASPATGAPLAVPDSSTPKAATTTTTTTTLAPTPAGAADAVQKKPKTAPKRKPPMDFDPDWNTKLFQN